MKHLIIALSLTTFLFTSCKEQANHTPSQEKVSIVEETLPANLFSDVSGEAISVTDAKAKKTGEEVIISGKVLGARQVFVDNRASFIIGNPDVLTSCDIRHGDNCKSPWDVCCEAPKDVQANTINVQVLGANDKILKANLEGKGDLNKLSHVIVKGKVSDQSSDAVTIINAESIQVK